MVNSISSTFFLINTTLLDYINGDGVKHNLLVDPHLIHKFSDLKKRTKYQKRVLASYNSKIILQETILDIVELYNRFNYISRKNFQITI